METDLSIVGSEEFPLPSLEEGVLCFADRKAFHVTGFVEKRGSTTERHLCCYCCLDHAIQCGNVWNARD